MEFSSEPPLPGAGPGPDIPAVVDVFGAEAAAVSIADMASLWSKTGEILEKFSPNNSARVDCFDPSLRVQEMILCI